jgi:hypothetical protein
MPAVVLSYHSHNISGNEYWNNDHVALAADLETITRAGAAIVPLAAIADKLAAGTLASEASTLVGISFDDGPVFDVEDFVHPLHGAQRSFLNILRDFAERNPGAQPSLHATSFVIASPEARHAMERSENADRAYPPDWLHQEWWPRATASKLMDIGNHSWDHVHEAVASTVAKVRKRNDFGLVRDYPGADAEIRAATEYINSGIGGACTLFAYPFGQSNPFLVRRYFPERQAEHKLAAAFSADGRAVRPGDSRWNIPRYVCGHHWKRPAELAAILADARKPRSSRWKRLATFVPFLAGPRTTSRG